jgi:hypothetical protein
MPDIDYGQLQDGGGTEPPDGVHEAALVRAKLVDTRNGTKLVTEWQGTRQSYYWTTWFGFDGQQMRFTGDFLDGIGLANGQWRKIQLDDERLELELSECIGTVYRVETKAGASWINVDVLGTADDPALTRLDDDLGTDTSDLPPVPVPGGGTAPAAEDDDIPF